MLNLCRIQIWNSEIASSRPAVQYTEVLQGAGMAALLHKIVSSVPTSYNQSLANKNKRTYGFCIVEDMPATPEATEAFLASTGPIRNTHYGSLD